MTIDEFIWPEERIEHIAQHGVTPEEVEDVCFGKSFVRRAKSEGRAMKKSKLPKTDSIQELAEFWDTHDLTDFEDELEEVAEPFFVRSTAIKVPLESREVEAVEQMAHAKGISREELIRVWVQQKLTRRSQSRSTKR